MIIIFHHIFCVDILKSLNLVVFLIFSMSISHITIIIQLTFLFTEIYFKNHCYVPKLLSPVFVQ